MSSFCLQSTLFNVMSKAGIPAEVCVLTSKGALSLHQEYWRWSSSMLDLTADFSELLMILNLSFTLFRRTSPSAPLVRMWNGRVAMQYGLVAMRINRQLQAVG
eukprot:1160894-Pelagomonas_calceolata.AAC.14